MMKILRNSISMVLMMTVLLGLGYPLAMTGVASVAFKDQAKGSVVTDSNGKVVGSAWIGQNFSKPEYFHGRPSAAGAQGYDGVASGGSNLGPTSKKLQDIVKQRAEAVRKENGLAENTPVPSDLVMASSSGLDPHISPASATLQIKRVAKARHLTDEKVMQLVSSHTEMPLLGFLGQPRVNVLELNIALDHMVE